MRCIGMNLQLDRRYLALINLSNEMYRHEYALA
jgi:hypothetical protein